MPAFRVVEHLDVIEDVPPGLLPVVIGFALDALPLQQLEETLRHGIVVTVPTPTHAGYQVMSLQEVPPVVTAELAPLVGMHQYLLLGLTSPYRHQQGIQHQLSIDT